MPELKETESIAHRAKMSAPPSTAYDEQGTLVETADVWWYIHHYESYCQEHGIPINTQLYL